MTSETVLESWIRENLFSVKLTRHLEVFNHSGNPKTTEFVHRFVPVDKSPSHQQAVN